MRHHPVIQRFLALLLLALFAFSIMPKKVLHDAIVAHRDTFSKHTTNGSADAVISQAGYNCNCDNLVAESPFVQDAYSIAIIPPDTRHVQVTKAVNSHILPGNFFVELRGPPVVL